ncbi:MAG: hypothetical protein IT310_12515 [Anaerolineales bacterium]|nr:hypothetical protein [Anaerolineales bacterium]
MNGFRDLEQLSADLDGQLAPSESARLKSRLQLDPELAEAYEDMRQAKGILQKLPARKAPRNFTLTRKMVGLKPPLPRVYPTFKFATTFATILFAISLVVNGLSGSRMAYSAASAPVPDVGQGGGAPDDLFTMPMAAATEAPAATDAPATEAAAQLAPELGVAESSERIVETPTAKDDASELQSQAQGPQEPRDFSIPFIWQALLIAVILIGGLALGWMNQSAKRKWRNE